MKVHGNIGCYSGLVFWARLKGFADWPARICSMAESDALRKKMQSQMPTKDSVAVSFLGLKCEKYVYVYKCTDKCMHACANIVYNVRFFNVRYLFIIVPDTANFHLYRRNYTERMWIRRR
jgi:hypothetical protein